MDQRHRYHGGNVHETDAYRGRQDDPADRKGLQADHVYSRPLEERDDGRGVSVLGQPVVHDPDWLGKVGTRAFSATATATATPAAAATAAVTRAFQEETKT